MSLAHQIVPAGEGNDGLALDLIQIDGGTQSRAALNQIVVEDYAWLIKGGVPFPPIVVFYDGKKHWLADGFHRFHAYQKAGRTHARADVRQGTRRDAILHSVGANHAHGLRRTNDDKRRAVLTLLSDQEWSAKPERWIATTANVSHTFVQKVRAANLATLPDRPAEVEVERGGKVYTQKVAKAAAQNAPKALDNDEPSPEAGPQAEASLAGTGAGTPADREGRSEGEAASVDLPTVFPFDAILALWCALSVEDREAFVAYLRVSGVINEPAAATDTAGDYLREPAAVVPGQIIREGDAPRETGRLGGVASSPDTESNPVANVGEGVSGAIASASIDPASRDDDGADLRQPASSGFTGEGDGRDVEADGGAASVTTIPPSDGDAFSEVKGSARPESAAGAEPPPSVPSQPDMIRRIRPHCAHPDDLSQCAGVGRKHCHACAATIEPEAVMTIHQSQFPSREPLTAGPAILAGTGLPVADLPAGHLSEDPCLSAQLAMGIAA